MLTLPVSYFHFVFFQYLGSFPVTEPTPDARASYVGKQLELIAVSLFIFVD